MEEDFLAFEKRTLDSYLETVDYSHDEEYVPSVFALEFLNFIKMVHRDFPIENVTPVAHLKYLDKIIDAPGDVINLCHRGFAKSTILGYLILYLAVNGGRLPKFGQTKYILYVSDTIDNGVKKMKDDLMYKCQNSGFLQEYLPIVNLTVDTWIFKNADGEDFRCDGNGAATGIRGTRAFGERPGLALLDDLMSDKVAESPASMAKLEEVISGALEFALHPTRKKIIWSGTPFNSKDAIVNGIESGSYTVNVFPVAESFPVKEGDFKGSWEERFTYKSILTSYLKAKSLGKVANFMREMMLRITSDEERIVSDSDIQWYSRNALLGQRQNFNFYITTDFATSEKEKSDWSVLSVWALNNKGYWYWVDGVMERQLMDKNVDALFRLAQEYNVQSVGIEVSGQQGGFIPWIQSEMMRRNSYFSLASDKNSGDPGIRPNKNKLERFNTIAPRFKQKEIFFPLEMEASDIIQEALNELKLVTVSGIKSKHDDFLDTISMLSVLNTWMPTSSDETVTSKEKKMSDVWGSYKPTPENTRISSYMV